MHRAYPLIKWQCINQIQPEHHVRLILNVSLFLILLFQQKGLFIHILSESLERFLRTSDHSIKVYLSICIFFLFGFLAYGIRHFFRFFKRRLRKLDISRELFASL